jgi:hypothetical protein
MNICEIINLFLLISLEWKLKMNIFLKKQGGLQANRAQ